MRYRVQVLGWTLIWSGLLVFGYVGWQLWVTDLLNAGVQAEAAQTLVERFEEIRPEPEPEPELEPEPEPNPEPELPTLLTEEGADEGEPFALMRIPTLEIDDLAVYRGVDRETLKKGPGHMMTTPLPGQPGNAVVSGHRTTYGRPFFDFDLLEPGDLIEVETAIGTHVYEVRELLVVLPTDVWVTNPRPGAWLTLTTCEPKFSARQRLIVFAEMVDGPNHEYANQIEVSDSTNAPRDIAS